MADRHPEWGPCRPLKVQKVKQPQRAQVACKSSPPVQDHPRVSCWKCGAFGPKASSLRCPMKRRSGALAPHALGSSVMKESQNPWTPRDLRNRVLINKAVRLTQQRVRHEEQRRALRQRLPRRAPGGHQQNWKDKSESCDYVRVRCWNCRAFGHKASRCPLKHWNRSPVPQAMGSNMMKENLKPWNPQVQRNPGHLNRAARETEQRAWHEEQREAPCWRFPWRPTQRPQKNWKEETEPCDYVSDPHTQRPYQNAKRKYVQDITPWSPKRKHVMTCSATPIKGVERSACLPPVPKNGQEGPVTDSPHAEGTHFVQDPSHSVHEGDNRPHSAFSTQDLDQALIHQPQAKFPDGNSHSIQHAAAHSVGQDSDLIIKVPGKRAAQTSSQTYQKPTKKTRLSPSLKSTQRPDLQPQHKGHLIKTLQPCHVPQFPPIPQVRGQPLRMVFTTLDKGQWSSRCMTPPSLPPAEMLTAAAQIPPTTEKSEALCPCVSLSILLEALQLSSSSKKVMANETLHVREDMFLSPRPLGVA
ncbi:Putative protein FAM90A14 [Myotis brandtii]|uniref:CCHC-type domain-containing protein n=1 Tax=Myotis brandtii TaxID=109478 RepID=S7N3V8_MYOBR|nr:PREDICTED: protein FAM90A1 [Myotis brandtii]EPQ11711.1 Putative protein FAM90A14 [Myotis brandtii]